MYKAPTNGSYTFNACCPKCSTVMSAQISAPEPSYVKFLEDQNARLREALEFTISAADYLYKTESPVPKGLDPMFYHSLSYEGDVELVEKTKKARDALEGRE